MTKPGPPGGTGLAPRRAALGLISDVLDRGKMLEEGRLPGSPAERAEARGLADLTLRRLGQIDDLLSGFVPREPKPPVNHVLRLMTAELGFAGTAAHAAVDSAVRLVKAEGAGKMSGLINAVGRRISREAPGLIAEQDAPALALPGWLADRLEADWGAETTRAIAAAHLTPAPHDLSFRAPQQPEGLVAGLVADLPGAALPSGGWRLSGRPQISALPGFAEGAWWAQDAAASLPAQLIPDPAGKTLLDLCAAPGGKTLQLAASGAQVTALDISSHRMQRVTQNLARTGLEATLITADALTWTPDQPFDAILLDAPCSATGTIRRHPDLPHRFQPKALGELHRLQAALIDRARAWLKPGGSLVYATCSLFKSEGEEQIAKALARHPDLSLEPASLPGLEPLFRAGQLRTLPSHWPEIGHLDGFFAARLRRI